jgi:chitodextrinase
MKKMILFLLTVVAVGWAFPMVWAQNAVATYTFSGNAKDGLGNDAAIYGARLTTDRFGNANGAFMLDGNGSYLEAPNSGALNTAYATVAFWVKPTALPAQGEAYLISFGGWQERYKISLPAHGKCIWTTNSSSGISDMDAGEGNVLVAGEWKHLAFVHDGTKDLIYINGVMVAEKNVSGTLNATSRPLGLGYDAVDKANFFNGALDEVMIFDAALSAEQIADLYAAQNTAPEVASGIVASYAFDEGSTTDGSGFGNHAVANGASPTTDRFGFGNAAYAFVAANQTGLTAPNSAHLNSGMTTISFWVNPRSFPGGGEAYLLSLGGWQERWKISLPNHGKPVFTTHSGGACCSDMDAGTPLVLNEWTHVVMTHDGTRDAIYLNGVLANEKAVSGMLDPTTYPLGIGYDPIDKANYFDGSIDDIAIYNTALDASEVASLYAAQSAFPGTATDLVAHYPLNGDASDVTVLGNDGTFNTTAGPDRHGWANNAAAFDGAANGIRAANSAALNSDYTTISFWVKPIEFPGSGEVFLISNGGWQERLKISLPSHGKPVFTTHSGGACCSDMDSGTPLALGEWTHVAMTHDGEKDIIYLNGVPANEKAVSGALDKTTHPFGIGYDPIDGAGFFNGMMDDVRVYNRALNATEIASLYADQQAAPMVEGDLVAAYGFAGDATDATAYQNHAQVSGALLGTDRFGKANQSYDFDGIAAGITAANSPQHNTDFTTISFWVNPKSLPGSGEVYLLSNGGWQERWKISLPSHGKPVFTTHSGGACCSDMDSGTPLAVGEWTHVAMTHDGSKDIIYLNGVLANEKAVSGALDPTTYPLGIGYDPIDKNFYFDGAIDEVMIFNRALSAAEIAELYDLQSTAPANADNEAPAAPINLQAAVNFTDIALSWLPASDNVGVVSYNVYKDGSKAMTVTSNAAVFTGLPQLTTFQFAVSAVDAAGNESLRSFVTATSGEEQSPDITAPTDPSNLKASVGAYSVLFSWEASVDDRQLAGYVVQVDGVYYDSLSATQTSIFIAGLTAQTPYTLGVYAFDKAGNQSGTAEIDITTDEEIDTGEPGLVAHYPFEGNAEDATPYANHGVAAGDVTYINAEHGGPGGLAVKFDGDRDSILAPNAVQLISDYTSVAFWIRVDDQNLQDAEAYVLDFGHWDQRWKISLPQHLKIVWTTNSNNTQFPVFISDMDSGDGNEMVKGFWWHVVMTHDGTDDKIYVNGQLANTKPVAGKLNNTARPLGMGNNPIEGGQYFNGALDELKIYNKALTPKEVENLYNSGITSVRDLMQQDALQGWIEAVYPIPATEELFIKHNFDNKSALTLRVFDLQGRQLDQVHFDRNEVHPGLIALDVADYPQGMLFLNFVLEGESLGSIRFVKK